MTPTLGAGPESYVQLGVNLASGSLSGSHGPVNEGRRLLASQSYKTLVVLACLEKLRAGRSEMRVQYKIKRENLSRKVAAHEIAEQTKKSFSQEVFRNRSRRQDGILGA